ncbi:MAG: CotH kinase family protein [Acidobacteria bacterium]|nr:CotH kinase family protein [Acidobacteriota bacterium]
MTRQVPLLAFITVLCATGAAAQGGGGFGPPGFGFGGQQELQLVAQFDRDGNGRLDVEERRAARESLGGGAGGGRFGRTAFAVTPGARLAPADVKSYPASVPVYDPGALRTIFLQFENADWEQELAAFYNTDVEVPATMIVDGRTYRDVGVHFRGNSSYRMVPAGYKHSLNLTLDFVHDKQDLGGYNSFNLLNSNNDPTFVRTALYAEIARHYLPIAKVNHVRVVINGESWGIYVSSQQVDKDFLEEWFKTRDGARWRVPGNPRGRAGLEYLGDNVASYRRLYQLRTDEDPKAWADLIRVCKVLTETPPEKLEAALAPLLDVDGVLKFLALDVALVNSDGYWTRASDYNIYQDSSGRFHIIPHDFNESMGGEGGRGFGPGRAGPDLDPLVGLNDVTKALRSKLLAVPALRARYLGYVRDIAEKWLDWRTLGPIAQRLHDLIAADVKIDTRKLYGYEEFQAGLASGGDSIRTFADRRRAYLLNSTAR